MRSVIVGVGALAVAGIFAIDGCLGITGDFNFNGKPVGGTGGTGGGAGGSPESGPPPDGGPSPDGGPPSDGGPLSDGGPSDGGPTNCPAGNFWNDATSQCQAWTVCTAGEQIDTLGSSTTDQTCKPCGLGTFSVTSNAATCSPYMPCMAGQYVSQAGTPTSDEVCSSCPSGQYTSAQGTATQCTPWSSCAAGTYVSAAGTSTSDRSCMTCASGTYTTQANQSTCLPAGACAAGTVQTAPATGSTPAVCSTCPPGNYCAGGAAAEVPCAAGTWDDDGNSATACVPQTQCGPGAYVSSSGSATADQSCLKCASGSFSSTSNATMCTTWTVCSPGQQILSLGSTTTDQTCELCAPTAFSTTNNAASCTAWTNCSPGQYVSQAGTGTTDRGCAACPANETTTTSNASTCVCDTGLTACGSTCLNVLGSDATNCGACGHSCLGGQCSAGACQPVTLVAGTSLSGASVVLDATNVYYNNGAGIYSCPLSGNCGSGTLMYTLPGVPGGVNDVVLYVNLLAPPASSTYGGSIYVSYEADDNADDENFMWAQIPKASPSTAKATLLQAGGGNSGGLGFDAVGGWVYYTNGVLDRMKPDTTQGTTVSASPSSTPTGWAPVVDSGGNVYFGLSSGVYFCNATGTCPTPQAELPSLIYVQGIYTDGTAIWVTDLGTGSGAGLIYKCAAAMGCSGSSPFASNLVAPNSIVADSRNVYWSSSSSGKILYCPVAGCGASPAVLVSSAPGIASNPSSPIVQDANFIYWADSVGIRKVAKAP